MEKERKHHAYSTDLKGSHEDIADLGHSVEKSLLKCLYHTENGAEEL